MADKSNGRYDYSDGTYYVGELEGGKPNGFGTYYYKGGTWTGEFRNGRFNGKGKRVLNGGSDPVPLFDNREYEMRRISIGVWKNNKREGRFVEIRGGMPYDEEYSGGKAVEPVLHYDLPVTDRRPDAGTVKCYYGGQSGFIIETVNETLVFDWYRAGIPELDAHKPVYIFVSHIHGDHFDRRIFGLRGKYNVRGVYLGLRNTPGEIKWRSSMPQEWKEFITFCGGEQHRDTDFGWVKSLTSTDLGVAFIVKAGGHTFYHAGDLFWMADMTFRNYLKKFEKSYRDAMPAGAVINEDIVPIAEQFYPREVETAEAEFKKFTAPLRDIGRIDYAMLPLDPRWYDYGIRTVDYYLGLADIRRFTPMHLWEQYDFVTDYLKHSPVAAEKMIAVNPDGCGLLMSIELNKPYFVSV
ncbi:hypothetical protein SAMN02910456_01495 [Ruminococcaceae bacterium YRB3002]|nr:hypothetical protein SAMN02910456_01495 [Ruminococcaceae bacterium YRB3002]